jgi:hypothetical protein
VCQQLFITDDTNHELPYITIIRHFCHQYWNWRNLKHETPHQSAKSISITQSALRKVLSKRILHTVTSGAASSTLHYPLAAL